VRSSTLRPRAASRRPPSGLPAHSALREVSPMAPVHPQFKVCDGELKPEPAARPARAGSLCVLALSGGPYGKLKPKPAARRVSAGSLILPALSDPLRCRRPRAGTTRTCKHRPRHRCRPSSSPSCGSSDGRLLIRHMAERACPSRRGSGAYETTRRSPSTTIASSTGRANGSVTMSVVDLSASC